MGYNTISGYFGTTATTDGIKEKTGLKSQNLTNQNHLFGLLVRALSVDGWAEEFGRKGDLKSRLLEVVRDGKLYPYTTESILNEKF